MPLILPNLQFVLALISSFYTPILGFAFPALLQFCVLYPNHFGTLYWRLIVALSHFVFGIVGFCYGLFLFNRSIISQYETQMHIRIK